MIPLYIFVTKGKHKTKSSKGDIYGYRCFSG